MMKILIWALILVSTQVLAWGPTGHRVVGEVAEKFMTDNARFKSLHLLGGHSLARASTWADEIRSDPDRYAYTFSWHFTDWPEGEQEHSEHHSEGKLLTAIHQQVAVLKDVNASAEQQAFALKFLVHLVGDLHMPLHVGNGLDRGGNNCRITFHGKSMNLHALWDEGLIDFTRLSFTELTDFVVRGRGLPQIDEWRKGSIIDWARESKLLRETIYPDSAPGERVYCQRQIELPTSELPVLGYEYSYRFMPMAEDRLFQAGLRLAVLLNSAWSLPEH